jgi:KaiC/GvpD/RAD55 family RecA-like ATPase
MHFETFPGSNLLVKGRIPCCSLLLIGPTGVGKTIFCKHFLYSGLKSNETCIYVSTSEIPKEIILSMKKIDLDITSFLENGMLRIIDGCSWKVGKKSSSQFAVDGQHNYLTSMSIAINKAKKNLQNIRFIFDSISDLVALSDNDSVINFLQILTGKIRLEGGKALFTIATGAHDEHFIHLLRLTFDGILEMKLDDSGFEIKRLLRVFSLKGIKHKTSWTPFEITDNGIVLQNESQLRCSLCSKPILWEPITIKIANKEFFFDTQDCLNTYKKFKSVYGDDFT